MKIALGIHRLSPRGGLEDNCIRIAEELERRGHWVVAFIAGANSDVHFPIQKLSLPWSARSNHARQAAFAKAFIIATKGRFDRTVAFQPIPGANVLFLADTLRNKPGTAFLKRLTPRFRTYTALEKGCFGDNAATRIIGLAKTQMRQFADRYPSSSRRISLVPPTLPISRRRPELRATLRATAREELGLHQTANAWLWLGLQPNTKGLDRVIKALDRHPSAQLLVGGLDANSLKMKPIMDEATKLGVANRVRCLGYVSGERFFSVLAAADVLAHPARVDVTGGVILEAIVNGLPVVATDVCGFAGHITDSGAGRVLSGPFDDDAFSRLIGEVQSAPIMSTNGVEYGANPALYSGISAACDLIES